MMRFGHGETGSSSRPFPPGFLWGAATSPTQIEGCTHNEWRTFTARDGTMADAVSTHWKNPARDLQLLSDLNLNSYRMGLDWGRLQHGPLAALHEPAVTQYAEMIRTLTARGIEPFVTLFHFACPEWFAALGGWDNPASVEYFLDFVRRVAELALPVRHWITFNEPCVHMTMAYLIGLFPPHKRFALRQAMRVIAHQALAHKATRHILQDANPSAMVGISKHFKRFIPARRWHPLDWMNVRMIKSFFNERLLNAFLVENGEPSCDFLGVNYYGRFRVRGFSDMTPISGVPRAVFESLGTTCDDMWEQDPKWLKDLLVMLREQYRLPLFITESGFATDDEELRCRLLSSHLESLQAAVADGVDVRGFYYWSLMDNFEWAEGITKRFGLAAVDFSNPDMPRSIRKTGHYLAIVAKNNALRNDTARPV